MAGLPRDSRALVAAFLVSGTTHLVRPRTFASLMPPWVPRHRDVIYASGVAELLCAAGMLHPRTRRAAGWASAAVLVGVFPAHVQMTQDAFATDDTRFKVISVARMPLQLPMIRAALRAARA